VSRMPSTNHGGWRIGAEEAAGGAPQVVAMNLRGREEGARAEFDDLASVRASAGGSSRSYIAAEGVRRLTPRECERLQGFPDDWTLISWMGKPAPDSRRYAALGDAVTVPVARWLGQRLAAATEMEMAA
jgi:DNA (cytosine-5)-methyltransferase 1